MNNVNLIGRIEKIVISAEAMDNQCAVNFLLTVEDDAGVEQIPCIAHGIRAELIAKYMQKGDRLIISGRLFDMVVEVLRVTFALAPELGDAA